MSFYADFATHYEKVFPLREKTFAFLREHLPQCGAVLDAGCGPGHYCGRLADSGLAALGVDLDDAMIAAARARYPSAAFRTLDLRAVGSLDGPLQGAYCIGNVWPHLAPSDQDRALHDLAALLVPGAPWLVQTVNFDRLLPLVDHYDFPDLDVGGGLVFRRRYEPRGDSAVAFRTELRDGAHVLFAGNETLWPHTGAELAARHEAAGLTVTAQLGDFAGTPFDAATSGACILVTTRAIPPA